MKRFSIVAKKDDHSIKTESTIKCALEKAGFVYDKIDPELVITVGGDGTLLYAVHEYLQALDRVHFVAIHTGTLGFFTDYRETEIEQLIHDVIRNEVYEIFTSSLLEAKLNHQVVYALNELRIENIVNTQMMDVYIDDEFFESFKGNGMCLSTQAGSTAYNRSLRGAVVDSGLSVLQLSEIAGIHDARHRSLGAPYILKDTRSVRFVADDFEHAKLGYDYLQTDLKDVQTIDCKLSSKKVHFIRYKKYSYLKRVRNLY
ncbi:MAG: NAD kinase [Breznakia sp.]